MLGLRQLTRPNGRAHLFLRRLPCLESFTRSGFSVFRRFLSCSDTTSCSPAIQGSSLGPNRSLVLVSLVFLPFLSCPRRSMNRRGYQGASSVLAPVAIAAPCVFSNSRSLGHEQRWCEGSQRVYLGRRAVGGCEKAFLSCSSKRPPGAIRTSGSNLNPLTI